MKKINREIFKSKKLPAILLTVVMLIGMIPFSGLFAEPRALQDPLTGSSITTRKTTAPKGSDGAYYYSEAYTTVKFAPDGSYYTINSNRHVDSVLLGKDTVGHEQWLYCIEQGTAYSTDGYSGTDSTNASFLNTTIPNGLNKLAADKGIAGLDGDKSVEYMKICTLYGWQPNVNMPAELQSAGLNEWDWFMGTQTLLWEFQQGIRQSFTQCDGNGFAAANAKYQNIAGRPAQKAYEYIVNMGNKHKTKPSFASKTPSTALTITLSWNGTDYETTVLDNNNYNADILSNAGITVTKNNNKYTFKSANPVTNGTVLTLRKNMYVPTNSLLTWGKAGKQTMASGMSDPVRFYVKVKTTKPTIKIVKRGASAIDYANRTFDIYDLNNNIVKTLTTDDSGNASSDLNNFGVYKIKERNSDGYDVQYSAADGSKDGDYYCFPVNNDGTLEKTITVTNTKQKGALQIIKKSEDNVVENLKFKIQGNGIDKTGITDNEGYVCFEKDVKFTSTWTTSNNNNIREELIVEHGMTVNDILNCIQDGHSKYKIMSGYNETSDTYSTQLNDSDILVNKFPCALINKSDNSFKAQIFYRGGFGIKNGINVDKVTQYNVNNAKEYLGTSRGDSLADNPYPRTASLFNQYDVNYDGKITQDDIDIMQNAVTNNDGVLKTDLLMVPFGEYTITEIETPARYVTPSPVSTIVLPNKINTVHITNYLKKSGVKIIKTSDDGIIEGIHFSITGVDTLGNIVAETAVTDNSGTIVKELYAGDYVVKEVQVPERYIDPGHQIVTIAAASTEPTEVIFNNKLKTIPVTVIKSSEDSIIENVKFSIIGTNVKNEYINKSIITNSTGKATADLLPGTYTVSEIMASDIYVPVTDRVVTVDYNTPMVIKNGETVETSAQNEINISNNLKKFNISLFKKDSERNVSQGNASLKNAVYGLYKDGTLMEQLTTDENGHAVSINSYPCGDYNYYVKEITAPNGYKLDNTEYPVEVEAGDFHSNTTVELVVKDNVYKGNIHIIKYKGVAEQYTREANAKFEVYLKSAGSYNNANEWERDILTTCSAESADDSATGEATLAGEAGSKDLPYGIYVVKQISGAEGYGTVEAFDVDLTNTTSGMSHSTTLYDETLPVPVTLKKTNLNGDIGLANAKFVVKNSSDTIVFEGYTNADGKTSQIMLAPGVYTFMETEAPNKYAKTNSTYTFTVKGDRTITGTTSIKNDVVRYKVKKIDENGNVLGGAIFAAYNNLNVEIARATSDNDTGIAEFTALPVGTYEIKEIKAPIGYKLSNDVNTVTITNTWLNNISTNDIQNRPTEVVLYKKDITTAEGIPGAQITIYDESGIEVSTGITDNNGEYKITNLPEGKYTFKETVRPNKYRINETVFNFRITETGDVIGDNTITDELIEHTITKRSLDGTKAIEGCEITVYDINKNEIFKGRTNSEGQVKITNLETGKYTFKETHAPTGYAISLKEYSFNVDENGNITGDNELRDDITRFIINKVDKNNNPLKGVIFAMYDENGNEISQQITNDNGIAEFTNFPEGKFTIKEIKPLDGYEILKETYNIINDGKWDNNANSSTITVINNLISVNITSDKVAPKTGDSTNVLLYLILFVISLSSLIIISVYKIKNK